MAAEQLSRTDRQQHLPEEEWSSADAADLPPRSVVRKQREKEKREQQIKEQETDSDVAVSVHIPIVRLMMILFFLLVFGVITYPVWGS
ncbi:hypothetical protein [Alteribacter natronophilus]|uniref:hypothetical protein n=1 Tax=Alteribacter natronophilus TaxID=2583810 RepID=UPI00110E4068|nr:hypothetical protein [Alteribacter natronophilus]TMW73633.1 hypothetical protein FGB90_04860 [Alteribacter natronophilus]